MDNRAYPPLYRSRRRRIPWAWIVAIAATIAIAGAMALAYDAESATLPALPPAPRCAAELTTMRRACVRSRWIGEFAPRSCETARAGYSQCLAGK